MITEDRHKVVLPVLHVDKTGATSGSKGARMSLLWPRNARGLPVEEE